MYDLIEKKYLVDSALKYGFDMALPIYLDWLMNTTARKSFSVVCSNR